MVSLPFSTPMRLAFVVGSAYEKNGQLPLLSSAEIDGQYLARRLGLEDVEATVVELPAERGVAERIEQALTDQPGPIESVLVVFVGYGVFSKDRGAALLLDGDRLGTFSFVRLRSLLERYTAASCVIAEVFLIGDGAADLGAASDAIHGALTERHARGTCGVIAVRPSEGIEANEPALAAMVTTALDWLSASGSHPTVSISTLFEQLKADDRFGTLPVVRLITSASPFLLVGKTGKGAAPAQRISAIPAAPSPSGGWPETITAPPPAVAAVPAAVAVVPATEAEPAPSPATEAGVLEPATAEAAPESVIPDSVVPDSQAAVPTPPPLPTDEARKAETTEDASAASSEAASGEASVSEAPVSVEAESESKSDSDSDSMSAEEPAPAEAAPEPTEAPLAAAAEEEPSAAPAVAEPWDTDEDPDDFDNDGAGGRPVLRVAEPSPIADSSAMVSAAARGGSVRPLPLPSSPPVKTPGLAPPPPLPGMPGGPALVAVPKPSASPPAPVALSAASPAPADVAALFADVPAPDLRNGTKAELPLLPPEMPVALGPQGEFRPTVAVSSLSDRFGEEPPPSDALPSFGGSTLAADELFAKGEFEAAIQEYEAVLVLLAEDDDERALALARLSRAHASVGHGGEAEARFAEALALAPRHTEVLSTRAELDDRSGDMGALLLSTERWLGRAPENPRAIELLAKAATATGDVRRAIDAERRLARSALTGVERARSFLESSQRAENELADSELSLALSLEGLELSPSDLGLLDRASALLDGAGRSHELLAYYERAMSQILDPGTAEAIASRIERLALEPDADPRVAVAALERLLETRPGDAKLRHRVAELYTSLGDAPRALQQVRLAVQADPRDPAAYRRAHGLFEQLGDVDGSWNACMVLESLGEADINESLLASQHRTEGLLQVRGVALDADWAGSLFHEDEEPELRALFSTLGAASVRLGVANLKDKKRAFEPDPATLQDPEKSTTMLAKTLGWSARLLGFPMPEFYLLPDMAPGLAIAPRETPGVLAARALGSGIELGELPFLWGRVLVRLRPELRPLTFFRGPELAAFVTAVLALCGARGVDSKALDKEPKKHYAGLKRELKGTDLTALKAAGKKIPAAELGARLQRLELCAELAGVRAGLTLVGDVCRAADLIRRFPTEGVTRAEDQLSEAYRFAISDAYARLRQKLGIGV
jgi:tetratricopeptide (TPR) repeat protein